MAWEARSGLKLIWLRYLPAQLAGLNGLGGPCGFETEEILRLRLRMTKWRNGLGRPFECG